MKYTAKINQIVNALRDFVEFSNDPNMPIQELVQRANEALEGIETPKDSSL